MEIGKVPNSILESLILNKLKNSRKDVLLRPGIGEDCSAVDFGEYACVLSCDPITGTAMEIGRLAVNISCNDIASCGVEPIGLLVALLCPPGTTEAEIGQVMGQLTDTAAEINVDILGGHTEITSAVTRFIITCTAVGRCLKEKLITTAGAQTGDCLVLSKHAGLEGASIIAHEKEMELTEALGEKTVNDAKGFMKDLSVVKEGLAAAVFGVNAMHDVTEGGILGAVWEICEASGHGAEILIDNIPVTMSTRRICEYYGISPYKLISSGCMLISATDGDGLVKHLQGVGVSAEVIGKLNGSKDRMMIVDGKRVPIPQPESDEIYKVV